MWGKLVQLRIRLYMKYLPFNLVIVKTLYNVSMMCQKHISFEDN